MTIFILLGLFMIVVASVLNTEADYEPYRVITIFIVIIGSLIVGISAAKYSGYKQGQIDALKGKYKYEMQIKQDTVYIKK